MGCASIARKTVLKKIIDNENFELVAVASRNSEKARMFAELFKCEPIVGYQNLLNRNDIEAIYMPLPTGLHDEWCLNSILSKKHILVEKSFSSSYSKTVDLLVKAKANGLVVMENFMFKYHSQHRLIKNLIQENEIGEIRCFRSSFGFPPLHRDNFRYNKNLGGGALLDAGAYTLKAAQIFLGSNLKILSSSLVYNENQVDIYGGIMLENQKRQIGQLSFGFDNFYQCNYEIWGSKGKITAKKAFTPDAHHRPEISLEKQGSIMDFRGDADDHFKNILNEFANEIFNFKNRSDEKKDEIINQIRLIEEVLYQNTNEFKR